MARDACPPETSPEGSGWGLGTPHALGAALRAVHHCKKLMYGGSSFLLIE